MKKKLLVLLIAAASTMMPNMVSAVAIDVGDLGDLDGLSVCGLAGGWDGCKF